MKASENFLFKGQILESQHEARLFHFSEQGILFGQFSFRVPSTGFVALRVDDRNNSGTVRHVLSATCHCLSAKREILHFVQDDREFFLLCALSQGWGCFVAGFTVLHKTFHSDGGVHHVAGMVGWNHRLAPARWVRKWRMVRTPSHLPNLSAGLSMFDAACFIRCLRVLVAFSWRMGKDAGFPLTPAGMTGGAWAWLRIRDSREFLITLAPAFGYRF